MNCCRTAYVGLGLALLLLCRNTVVVAEVHEEPQNKESQVKVRAVFINCKPNKLQADAAQSIKEEKEVINKPTGSVAPLRLPKHLESSARADTVFSATIQEQIQAQAMSTLTQPSQDSSNGELSTAAEVFKQVHFQEPEENYREDVDDDNYEHYENNGADDAYYNGDDEDTAAYYECMGVAIVKQGAAQTLCDNAHVQVSFDQEIYSPKILVTDNDTGEILADMLIHTDTEFQMSGDSCTWSGTDYTSHHPVDKTVTINFHDSESAMQFYDSCEKSKGATHSSTDPHPDQILK